LPVLRRRPAGRTRGCLLRSTPETSRRLRSQIRESPDSPGRFTLAVDVLFGQADFTLSSVHSAELASANSTSGHLQIAMVVLALLIAGLTAGGAFRMASGLGHA
ncbi:hypothetical protein ACNJTL_20675, partial [Mycobacterium tuberculosis]